MGEIPAMEKMTPAEKILFGRFQACSKPMNRVIDLGSKVLLPHYNFTCPEKPLVLGCLCLQFTKSEEFG